MPNSIRLNLSFSRCSRCSGLFGDTNHPVPCSIFARPQVMRRSLSGPSSGFQSRVVRSTAVMFNRPFESFLPIDLDLPGADHKFHRVQLFRAGQRNGSSGTMALYRPIGVIEGISFFS